MSKPFKCTSCGGPLQYEEGAGATIRCPFCDSSIIVPEELRTKPAAASWGTGLVDGIFKLQQRAANLQEVARLARMGRKIEAIKLYREIFGTGLEESKAAVERMAAGGPAEVAIGTSDAHAFQAHGLQPQALAQHARRSGLGWIVLIIVVGIVVSVGLGIRAVISRINAAIPTSVFPTSSGPAGSSQPAAPGFASVALKFGSEGIGPGMFKDARNIGVDGEGRIYVGEYLGSGRIQAFDASGKFITQWTVDPKMPMRALAADRKGTVYVTQRGEISRFDGTSGNPLGKVAYSSSVPGRTYFDNALSATSTGLFAIVNDEDIVRFDANGQVVRTISKAISAQTGDPERVDALAVDGLGNIYALSGHDAVYKFSPEGRFLNKFGGSGEEPGQLRAPDAIAVDGQGRVYVSDVKGIQVFDPDGRYLDVFKVPGHVASGMVFNDRNELLVAARTQVIKFTLNK